MSERPYAGAHVVAVANFFGPSSGGLRTAMTAIGREYTARGLRSSLIVPGRADQTAESDAGTIHTIAAPLLPGSGGYRLILRSQRVRALLDELRPDRVELSDRTTLHGVATWARQHDVPCVFLAHERVDGVLGAAGVPPRLARSIADVRNRATARSVAAVVATTAFAAAEFERIDAPVHRVPLGVDLETFSPIDRGQNEHLQLVLCSRLAREKRPGVAIETVRELRSRGVDARLVVLGHGPLQQRLERQSAGLPVTFLGFVRERERLRELLSGADVALAPGPIETFGLAALEAMACGTPVVVNRASALPEVVGEDRMAGLAAAGTAAGFADAVLSLAVVPLGLRRAAARRRASGYTWRRTAGALLELPVGVPALSERVRPAITT